MKDVGKENKGKSRAKAVVFGYGVLLLLLAPLLNPYFIELYLSENDLIETTTARYMILFLQIILAGGGVTLLTMGFLKQYPEKLVAIGKKSAVTLITIFVLFFVLEICARVFFPFERKLMLVHLQADELLGWRGLPNGSYEYDTHESEHSYTTNENGFRGEPGTAQKDATIAVFGDSFTFGCEVEFDSLFTSHIQRKGASWGRKVANYGMTAFSPVQELLLYRDKKNVTADTVVLMLYIGNDFYELGQSGDPFYVFRRPASQLDDMGVQSRSVQYSDADETRQYYSTILPESQLLNYLKFRRNPFGTLHVRSAEEFVEVALPDGDADLLQRMRIVLQSFHQLAYERKQTLITVLIPSHDQVIWAKDDPNFSWTDRQDLMFFDEYFRSLEFSGYHFHNLAPDLVEAQKEGKPLFFVENRHFTTLGHLIAANSIQNYLNSLQDKEEGQGIHDTFFGLANH